jgi:hypothetical protein
MKITCCNVLLALALTGWAVADLPKKAPLTKYNGLVKNSPFTSKPPPPVDGPVANPLEDYALGGISPIGDGFFRISLLNKKKPDERKIIDSDRPKEGWKVLEITRKAGDPLATVVRISTGSSIGSVGFDEKLLALAQPPAQKVAPKLQPGQPPQPGQQPGQSLVRQPRPRVVPPPTTQGAQGTQPQVPQPVQQTAPQVNPQVVPQSQGQPVQPPPRPGRHGGGR